MNLPAYQSGRTIVALATPSGEGGVAIVRVSGKHALKVANRLFSGDVESYLSHTAHFGFVIDSDGERIDEVLLLVMHEGRSYTGEHTVEIQCHGGLFASKKIIELAIEKGAEPAMPGEFTLKAFMNGRIDLTQAEAVGDLIHAQSDRAFSLAGRHLAGGLSNRIEKFQKELTDVAAILEAWVDFPEEGLEFASFEEIHEALETTIQEMQTLRSTFDEGAKIREGVTLALVGAPNVGKSSLLNALLGKERAIVTEVAGTTRDFIEESLVLRGLRFHLIDTAGIRETDDRVEKLGVSRSFEQMEDADIILFVLDATRDLDASEETLLKKLKPEKTLLVWNKMDQPNARMFNLAPHMVGISAKEKQGLDLLEAKLLERVSEEFSAASEDVMISRVRHAKALEGAIASASETAQGLKEGRSPEFLTLDIRQTLASLGLILGQEITEDVLSSIFSKFCIGK